MCPKILFLQQCQGLGTQGPGRGLLPFGYLLLGAPLVPVTVLGEWLGPLEVRLSYDASVTQDNEVTLFLKEERKGTSSTQKGTLLPIIQNLIQ
jgi:hypothetical protein